MQILSIPKSVGLGLCLIGCGLVGGSVVGCSGDGTAVIPAATGLAADRSHQITVQNLSDQPMEVTFDASDYRRCFEGYDRLSVPGYATVLAKVTFKGCLGKAGETIESASVVYDENTRYGFWSPTGKLTCGITGCGH